MSELVFVDIDAPPRRCSLPSVVNIMDDGRILVVNEAPEAGEGMVRFACGGAVWHMRHLTPPLGTLRGVNFT